MRALVFASLLAAPLLIGGCNSTKNPVTPKGTVLVEWDHTKASRAPFAKATVGTTTAKDFVVTVHPQGSIPFSVDLHVVFAPVDFVESGKTVHHTAPVEIKATVGDNTGWDLGGGFEDGPNYQMGSVDDAGTMSTPEAMVQDCTIHHRRTEGTVFESDWRLGFHLDVYGDGTVKPFPEDGIEVKAK